MFYDARPVSPPVVSAVLVDVDPRPISGETLRAAIANAEAVGGEVIVVDARTTAGRAWRGERRVRMLGASASAGSTALRLRAVAATEAPVVAFLDAAAVPSPSWLRASLRQLEQADVAAVSGASVDIGEPTVSLIGTVGQYQPLDHRAAHAVLYPVPEAAAFRTAALRDIGGFCGEIEWPSAVLDAGWRLNLRGLRVVLDPSAAITGRCSCGSDTDGGLTILNTCLGQETLERVLPAAMLVVAEGGAIDRFVARSGPLALRRADVQRTRVADEGSLLDLLIAPLEPPRDQRQLAPLIDRATERHDLRAILPTRQRILVVTPDIFTPRMAGPAIRAWQIAEALAARHLVDLVSTASTCELSSLRFTVAAPSEHELRGLAERADVILFQGYAMEGRPYLGREDKVVVVDLYDPLHLEQLELFRDAPEHLRRVTLFGATRVLNEQLARGDFFVCASAKQRDFWLGQLAALGRLNHATYDDDNRLTRLLDVVPFGLPDEPPVATGHGIRGVVPGIADDDDVIVWGGGIYNWFDPLTLILAVDRLKERRPKVRLFFLGLRHPNPEVTEMRMATAARRLANELGLTERHVFFNDGWVPYQERQNFLLDADVGVSTHFDHVETEFSFRTRILDYIWAGLPIVATAGDWFADLITSRRLGLVVPEQDVDALEEALFRLLSDPVLVDELRRSLAEVRREFAWSVVLQPLLSFCRAPRRAPDRQDAAIREGLWVPEHERHAKWLAALPSLRDRLRRSLQLG